MNAEPEIDWAESERLRVINQWGLQSAPNSDGFALEGFDTDLNPGRDENPLRVTLTLDLDPVGLVAVHSLVDALKQGLDIRIITQRDLIAAVDELLHNRHGAPSDGPPTISLLTDDRLDLRPTGPAKPTP